MVVTIRRYDGIDQTRVSELIKKVDDSFVPRLREISGFQGFSLVEVGDGAMVSVSFFDTTAQAEESTTAATDWIVDQQLESALPTPPGITRGDVVVHVIPALAGA